MLVRRRTARGLKVGGRDSRIRPDIEPGQSISIYLRRPRPGADGLDGWYGLGAAFPHDLFGHAGGPGQAAVIETGYTLVSIQTADYAESPRCITSRIQLPSNAAQRSGGLS